MWVNNFSLLVAAMLPYMLFNSVAMAASEESGETPGLGFLEFLGEFQTAGGQWMDHNMLLNSVAMAANEESGETPGLEFLEFLGEFQTADGQWIDPLEFLESEPSEVKRNDEDQPDE